MIAEDALRRLADRAGIGRGYHDIWGAYHETDTPTALALLAAMDLARGAADVSTALAKLDDGPYLRALPPVGVFDVAAAPYTFAIATPASEAHRELRWSLDLATGERWDAPVIPAALELESERVIDSVAYRRYRFHWRDRLPVGTHRFALLRPDGEELASMALAITPSRLTSQCLNAAPTCRKTRPRSTQPTSPWSQNSVSLSPLSLPISPGSVQSKNCTG